MADKAAKKAEKLRLKEEAKAAKITKKAEAAAKKQAAKDAKAGKKPEAKKSVKETKSIKKQKSVKKSTKKASVVVGATSVARRLSHAATPAATQPLKLGSNKKTEDNVKMFAVDKGPQRSKIHEALNPTGLAYVSRREKEEAGGPVVVDLRRRHGFAQRIQDEEGGYIVEEDSDEEDENFDPKNLPDFGEFQQEMDKMRNLRAQESIKHQNDLKKNYQKEQAAKQKAIDAELKKIKDYENKRANEQNKEKERMVKDAQARLGNELASAFDFSFE